jgi:hypothetical protein
MFRHWLTIVRFFSQINLGLINIYIYIHSHIMHVHVCWWRDIYINRLLGGIWKSKLEKSVSRPVKQGEASAMLGYFFLLYRISILGLFFLWDSNPHSRNFIPWMSSGNYTYHMIYCYEVQSLISVSSQNNNKLLSWESLSELISWKMCDVFSLKNNPNSDVSFSDNYLIIL